MVQAKRDTGITRQRVRPRSQVRSRKPTRSANRHNRFEVSIPPVMVRSDSSSLSGNRVPLRKTRPRRRIDVNLGMPGVEMRLPAMPQVQIGARMISGLLVVALIATLYYLWTSPTFQVAGINISGLQRLDRENLEAFLDIRNRPVFTLNERSLEDKLAANFAEFSSVQVEIALPNQVDVTVHERQPILTWRQGGRTVLVDANGVAFPLRNEYDSAPPIVVDAQGAPPVADDVVGPQAPVQLIPVEMVSAILSVSSLAPANTPIIYHQERGLGWRAAEGWEVYFGDVSDMNLKLRVYQTLVNRLKGERIIPALISVEFVHSPFYRLQP